MKDSIYICRTSLFPVDSFYFEELRTGEELSDQSHQVTEIGANRNIEKWKRSGDIEPKELPIISA